ncbi:hypothetical protein V6N13_143059 [Hibiscus sabdariffa]|uniref:Uncharacterized protein n=1 Tax=Hibiscus sabdariffa TaxID=183260 RepID=A0ABR2FGB3_9ROSI
MVRPFGDSSKGSSGPVASTSEVVSVSVSLDLSKHVAVRVINHSKTKVEVSGKVKKTNKDTLKMVQGNEMALGKNDNMLPSLSEQKHDRTKGIEKGKIQDSSDSGHVVSQRLSRVMSAARLGPYPSLKKQHEGVENTYLNVVNIGEWIGELARTLADKPLPETIVSHEMLEPITEENNGIVASNNNAPVDADLPR